MRNLVGIDRSGSCAGTGAYEILRLCSYFWTKGDVVSLQSYVKCRSQQLKGG